MTNQKFTEEYHFTTIEELLDAQALWKKKVNLDGFIFSISTYDVFQCTLKNALMDDNNPFTAPLTA